jgi:hypothetical protein
MKSLCCIDMCRHKVVCVVAVVVALSCTVCFGQPAQTITCPADTFYRQVPNYAGRDESCERLLPGSIDVKDGPSKFWFDPDFQGAFGMYDKGRRSGAWTECNSSSQCKQVEYPPVYPEEKQRPGFKPEVPVSYVDGKYVFDFESCRTTQITHLTNGERDFEMAFTAWPDGCFIDREPVEPAFREQLGYQCKIPFRAGRVGVASLDLRRELPKLGLPQYCPRPESMRQPSARSASPWIGEGVAQVFTAEYDTGNTGIGIAQAILRFQETPTSTTNRCVVRYDPVTKNLYLLSDAGKYLGPVAAGTSGSLWNSRCLLSGSSTAQLHGTRLTVRFAISFNPVLFSGTHNMYVGIVDTQNHAAPVPYVGSAASWNVPREGCGHWGVYTQSTLPRAAPPPSKWPDDQSCPLLTGPAPVTDVCSQFSGKWIDQAGGLWSLVQMEDRMSGSYKAATTDCGIVSWLVNGELQGGTWNLKATQPHPAVDECSVAPAASITATIFPNCVSGTRVELNE